MQITSVGSKIQSNVPQQRNAFTVEASAHTFQVLSKNLYSNPINACVREICCNAIDANASAGKADEPIMVHAPTVFEPWFSVTDNGIGLSPHDIEHLYTTYFASTKSTDDNAIGGYGLGCKSPFAYTDQFSIDARWEGNRLHYAAFIDETGIPSIQSMNAPTPTDKCNGITVKFAVKPNDISLFTQAIHNICQYFDVAPVGNVDFALDATVYDLEGEGWSIKSSGNGYYGGSKRYIRVIQGGVAYSVDVDNIVGLTEEGKALINHNRLYKLIMRAPIGSVLPAPSREQLTYNKDTCSFLCAMVNKIKVDLEARYVQDINACDTYYKAYVLYCESMYKLPFYDAVVTQWKGKPLSSNMTVATVKDIAPYTASSSAWHATQHARYIKEWVSALGVTTNNSLYYYFKPTAASKLLFLENSGQKHWARIKYMAGLDSTFHVDWHVFIGPKSSWAKMIKNLGDPEYLTVDDLSELPKSTTKRVANKTIVKPYTLRSPHLVGKGWTNYLSKTEIDMSKGGVYAKIDSWTAHDDFRKIEDAFAAKLVDWNRLIVVPKSMWNKFDEHDKWTHIEDYMDDKMSKVNTKKLGKFMSKYANHRAITKSNAAQYFKTLRRYMGEGSDIDKLLIASNSTYRAFAYAEDNDDSYDLKHTTQSALHRFMASYAGMVSGYSPTVKSTDWAERLENMFRDVYPMLKPYMLIPEYDRHYRVTNFQLTPEAIEDIITYIKSKG